MDIAILFISFGQHSLLGGVSSCYWDGSIKMKKNTKLALRVVLSVIGGVVLTDIIFYIRNIDPLMNWFAFFSSIVMILLFTAILLYKTKQLFDKVEVDEGWEI